MKIHLLVHHLYISTKYSFYEAICKRNPLTGTLDWSKESSESSSWHGSWYIRQNTRLVSILQSLLLRRPGADFGEECKYIYITRSCRFQWCKCTDFSSNMYWIYLRGLVFSIQNISGRRNGDIFETTLRAFFFYLCLFILALKTVG